MWCFIFSGLIKTPQDSLFYYNQSIGEEFSSFNHSDFVPVFGTSGASPELATDANQYCTRYNNSLDSACYFDYIASGGNTALALNSLEANRDLQTTAQDLGRIMSLYLCHFNRDTNTTANKRH